MFSSRALFTRLKDVLGYLMAAVVLVASVLTLVVSLGMFAALMLSCAVAEKFNRKPQTLPRPVHERIEPR